jgi:hypothetical protein
LGTPLPQRGEGPGLPAGKGRGEGLRGFFLIKIIVFLPEINVIAMLPSAISLSFCNAGVLALQNPYFAARVPLKLFIFKNAEP